MNIHNIILLLRSINNSYPILLACVSLIKLSYYRMPQELSFSVMHIIPTMLVYFLQILNHFSEKENRNFIVTTTK